MLTDILKISSFVLLSYLFRKRCKIREKNQQQKITLNKSQNLLNTLNNIQLLKIILCFKNTFQANFDNKKYATINKYKRLTPSNYNRHIFHMELNIKEDLKYKAGDCIGIKPQNSTEQVNHLLDLFHIDKNHLIKIKNKGNDQFDTIFRILKYKLDLNCKLFKKFFVKLTKYTDNRYTKLKFAHIGTDEPLHFKVLIGKGLTPYDILVHYHDKLSLKAEDFLDLLQDIKYRFYSISSSPNMHKNQIHLLIIVEDWNTTENKTKYGFCSDFLSNCKNNIKLESCIKSFDLDMSHVKSNPMIMMGLGTGIAPFRAFAQERKILSDNQNWSSFNIPCNCLPVEKSILFFGARYRTKEYVYGNEFDSYEKDDLLKLCLAFSRDQEKKVYIQNKIMENIDLLKDLVNKRNAYIFLCGGKESMNDIQKLLIKNGIDLNHLKEKNRYMSELY